MNDDFNLDDLKSLMDSATPAPSAARKAENIALAQKNFTDIQGSREQPRPTFRSNIWMRIKTMLNTLTSRGGLTATTAIVACGFMFITPLGQNLLNQPQPNIEPIAVAPEQARPAVTPDPSVPLEQRSRAEPSAETVAPPSVPAVEPELNDLATDLETSAVQALEALQAPAPVIAAEPTVDITAQLGPSPRLSDTAGREILLDTAPAEQSRVAPRAETHALLSLSPPAEEAAVADGLPAASPINTETFANDSPNPLKITSNEPVSTFSIDVDTAAYSLVRSSLSTGRMPNPDAVRIEELINYFPYDYTAPDGPHPFQPTVNVFETPWNADTQLVHIGIQGEMPAVEDRPPLNLVFLIDTSGSMDQPNKLPLLRQSFRLMLDNLRPEDEVAIVTYAGSSTIALEPTAAENRSTILSALNALTAGGSTNGQGGLEQAYALAEQMTNDGDVSRVILATDGDFNVGLSDPRGLETYIEDKRESGTYLSVLGFGRGNLQDATMQSLAQNGNGTAAYIDTLSEAQKVLVDNLTGALFPIANDVKIQVEFNPATVAEYRLIGYETRALAREDFNNDAVDAGELGAGHTVTAIYEVTPVGSPAQLSDPLRYQAAETATNSDELGFLRLRYKAPDEDVSQLIETPFTTAGTPNTDALFAASIAGFGQLLRDDTYLGEWAFDDAIALANANRGDDPFGYRTEAVQLMRLAQSLSE